MPTAASLFVIQGRDQGRRFWLSEEEVTLGREASNDIQVRDTEVSRRHARIEREEEVYVLVDLNSSNGTFVNDERVTKHVLRSGDRLLLGRTLLIFTHQQEQSSISLAEVVDIVGTDPTTEQSRIVRSISHEEGSQVFQLPTSSESPWLARARSNLQVMYRTALAVSHTLDIDQLLKRILELIFEWVDADRGCVMLKSMQTDELEPKAHRRRGGKESTGRLSISGTILDYVMEHKEGVLTSDARDDTRWDPGGSIVNLGVREAICVPMQGRYGIVGVIYVDTYTPPGRTLQGRNRFNEEHLKLMVAIGHQAALAVEDTRYYSAMVHAERLAAVGHAVATLSHHIKNILQGIRGGSYLIEEGLKCSETDVVRQGWGIVDRNQERISNLVMDMLSFSKDREPDLIPTDLNQVVGDVVELMQARAADQGVELRWLPDEQMPELNLDPEALHRAILNIVTNAIDACEEDREGRVLVKTACAPGDETAVITVEDNGVGIDSADLKQIFTAFESRKGSRGTGLGLPVSKKIVEEHGGQILVESEVGNGSRFTIELPALRAEGKRDTAFFTKDEL